MPPVSAFFPEQTQRSASREQRTCISERQCCFHLCVTSNTQYSRGAGEETLFQARNQQLLSWLCFGDRFLFKFSAPSSTLALFLQCPSSCSLPVKHRRGLKLLKFGLWAQARAAWGDCSWHWLFLECPISEENTHFIMRLKHKSYFIAPWDSCYDKHLQDHILPPSHNYAIYLQQIHSSSTCHCRRGIGT